MRLGCRHLKRRNDFAHRFMYETQMIIQHRRNPFLQSAGGDSRNGGVFYSDNRHPFKLRNTDSRKK